MDLDFFNFRMPDACYDMPWLNSGCDALAGRKIGMGFGMDVVRVSSDGLDLWPVWMAAPAMYESARYGLRMLT